MPLLTDFICIVNRELQNEKFLPTVGFEPGTFLLRRERAKCWAIRADKYRSPKGDCILPECAINSYMYRVVDVVKCFVVLHITVSKRLLK